MNTNKVTRPLMTAVGLSLLVGCASQQASDMDMSMASAQELAAKSAELDKRASALARQEAELASMKSASMSAGNSVTGDLLPVDAKSGECYARVWVEPKFKSVSQTVLSSEASETVSIIPARYEMMTEQVLVSEADYRIETKPATYRTESERRLVSAASTQWMTSLKHGAAPANHELLMAAKKGGIDLDSAAAGMCFHEHYIPAQYGYENETVLVKEAHETVSVSQPQYRMVEQQVLVKEASTVLNTMPAKYKTETDQVVDVAAHTIWKKGTGPIQKINEATGEIMCLVEVPATYKTISRRVIASAAMTQKVDVPAVYKTVQVRELVSGAQEIRNEVPAVYNNVKVKKQLADVAFTWHEIHNKEHPAATRTGNQVCLTETPAIYKTVTSTVVASAAASHRVEIPAVYKTVEVNKLVSSAQEVRTDIPAEYKTVTTQELASEGFMEWRSILCKTNMTSSTIADIQRALIERDYNPGRVDGVIGSDTVGALNSFQRDNDLPVGKYFNMESIKALGVKL
jgi:hypothetical protein